MTKEKLIHHLEHLREKHDKLDKQVHLMESAGSFDELDIMHIKKQRLAVKDEMQTVMTKISEFDQK